MTRMLPQHVIDEIRRGADTIRRICIEDAVAARVAYARRVASAATWSEQYDIANGKPTRGGPTT